MQKLKTIKIWWVQNTLIPIIVLSSCFILLISVFVYFQNKNDVLIKTTLTEQSTSTLTLALARKDRNLIEQVLATLVHTNHFIQVAICNDTEIQIQYPVYINSICLPHIGQSYYIPGNLDLRLVTIERSQTLNIIKPYFFLTIAFVLCVLIYSYFLNKRLRRDILVPLTTDPTLNLDCEINEIQDVRNKQKMLISEISSAVKNQNNFNLSKQVAHDIRSPVSALKIVAQAGKGMDQETKSLLYEIAERIDTIASKLLKKSSVVSSSQNFHTSLTALIREKRINYPDRRLEVSIKTSSGVEPNCSIHELMSVLSNIINNAFEASETPMPVSIEVYQENAMLEIIIRDLGVGIPSHLISLLGQQPITERKTAGNGLGVFNAYEFITAALGSISLKTRPDIEGTAFFISLPLKI